MKSVKKTLKIIANIIIWLFVAFAIFITILAFSTKSNSDGLPNIGGKALVNIQSDSMKGVFNAGDLIIVDTLTDKEKAACKKDDIITFNTVIDGKDALNSHRIIDVYTENGVTYYKTQGDNTLGEDAESVASSKVLGKYANVRIPFAGKAITELSTNRTVFLCAIVIPLILFFLFELYNFIIIIVKARSKGMVSQEDEEEIKRRAIEEYLRQQGQSEGEVTESAAAEASAGDSSETKE